ncbi:hypothetical protein CMK19_00330 [Candidatus Poribacteria bacterium]|nr:hypothetical protein [Candidatus Poribacteria bacterium]
MAEPLAPTWLVTMGEYLQEESEKQWFWFSVFIVTLLVGAFWLEASLTLPGVEESPILGEGETIEQVQWNDDGTEALILVGRVDNSPLRFSTSSGLSEVDSGNAIPRYISTTGSGWLISGDDGYLASFNGNTLNNITLNWDGEVAPDIISVASNDGDRGFIITKHGSLTQLHTFVDGEVSDGTPAPVDSTVMTSVHLSKRGHLAVVIGYDTALGNPSFGPAGEVIIRADAVLGDAPTMYLLHHGAGGKIHSAYFVDEGNWGDDVDMVIAGGTSTLLLLSDSSIIDLPGVGGSTAATIDENGVFWLARGDSLEILSISSDRAGVDIHKISSSVAVDAKVGTSANGEVQFYGTGVDGYVGVLSFDPSDSDDVSQSLALFGDLLFVIIVISCLVIIWHMFYVNELKPW